jgi:uncharacterized membrane protein YoaK (UPF0700 family)
MKLSLPVLLSLNAGCVDTAGFLALAGLFTAHVTGNFVTFGASIVFGTSGALPKLLALPVFCLVIVVTRLLSFALIRRQLPVMRTMLGLKLALLILAAVLAIRLGPFADGGSLAAIVTGMTLVCAMAIQNALHRIHLGSAPPTTLMTGTTTQIMIDLADVLHGVSGDASKAIKARMLKMGANVVAFAFGCGAGALLFLGAGMWCFALPPALGFLAFFAYTATPEGDAK